MLADRSYMRDPEYGSRWSLTNLLIAVLVACYLLQLLLAFGARVRVSDFLALSLDGMAHHRYWQLLSFQFLHSLPWPWHLLGNCLVLYFFGGALEQAIGGGRFLKLYFAGGFLGGGLQLLHGLLLHRDAGVVGASAGVSALLAAYCAMNPHRETYLVFYFFPVRLRARHLLWISLGISVFGILFAGDGIAHAAHLGGLLTGVVYARWLHDSEALAGLLARLRPRRRSSGKVIPVRFPQTGRRPTRAAEEGDFMSREVDPILDKIREKGIQSLTAAERDILERARSRMEGR